MRRLSREIDVLGLGEDSCEVDVSQGAVCGDCRRNITLVSIDGGKVNIRA